MSSDGSVYWDPFDRAIAKEKPDAVLLLGDVQYENGALAKFERLTEPVAGPALRRAIREAVGDLETIRVDALMALLAEAGTESSR